MIISHVDGRGKSSVVASSWCQISKHVVTLRSSSSSSRSIEFDKKFVNRGRSVFRSRSVILFFQNSDHREPDRPTDRPGNGAECENEREGRGVSQCEIAQVEQEGARRSRRKIITIASGFTFTSPPGGKAKITQCAAGGPPEGNRQRFWIGA